MLFNRDLCLVLPWIKKDTIHGPQRDIDWIQYTENYTNSLVDEDRLQEEALGRTSVSWRQDKLLCRMNMYQYKTTIAGQ
jgi:hypothetical protein